eukprot:TRINITY_DN1578_c0_g1_i1.p1 TRINITY_DN1578_c0_g1~~TRINITY_DN1578_c0_g1_i1.p1  ORF type:complete len:233 (+),score=75.99 TRINITY_DN1578_c0_g1_i1:1-699(+)
MGKKSRKMQKLNYLFILVLLFISVSLANDENEFSVKRFAQGTWALNVTETNLGKIEEINYTDMIITGSLNSSESSKELLTGLALIDNDEIDLRVELEEDGLSGSFLIAKDETGYEVLFKFNFTQHGTAYVSQGIFDKATTYQFIVTSQMTFALNLLTKDKLYSIQGLKKQVDNKSFWENNGFMIFAFLAMMIMQYFRFKSQPQAGTRRVQTPTQENRVDTDSAPTIEEKKDN